MQEKHTHLKEFELDQAEQLTADMLGPTTLAKLQTKLSQLVHESLEINFRGTAENRQDQMLNHAYLNGKIDLIRILIDECVEAYNHETTEKV